MESTKQLDEDMRGKGSNEDDGADKQIVLYQPAVDIRQINLIAIPSTTQKTEGPTKQFTLFSKLPTELRLKIWRYSTPEPRVIMVYLWEETHTQLNVLPEIAALHACREARTELLLKHSFEDPDTEVKTVVHVDSKKDAVFADLDLHCLNGVGPSHGHRGLGRSAPSVLRYRPILFLGDKGLYTIQHLTLKVAKWPDDDLDISSPGFGVAAMDCLGYTDNLKTVTLMLAQARDHGWNYDWSYYDEDEDEDETDENEAIDTDTTAYEEAARLANARIPKDTQLVIQDCLSSITKSREDPNHQYSPYPMVAEIPKLLPEWTTIISGFLREIHRIAVKEDNHEWVVPKIQIVPFNHVEVDSILHSRIPSTEDRWERWEMR